MSEIEYENAKREKYLADAKATAELAKVRYDAFNDLIQRYECVEKEVNDARKGGEVDVCCSNVGGEGTKPQESDTGVQ